MNYFVFGEHLSKLIALIKTIDRKPFCLIDFILPNETSSWIATSFILYSMNGPRWIAASWFSLFNTASVFNAIE